VLCCWSTAAAGYALACWPKLLDGGLVWFSWVDPQRGARRPCRPGAPAADGCAPWRWALSVIGRCWGRALSAFRPSVACGGTGFVSVARFLGWEAPQRLHLPWSQGFGLRLRADLTATLTAVHSAMWRLVAYAVVCSGCSAAWCASPGKPGWLGGIRDDRRIWWARLDQRSAAAGRDRVFGLRARLPLPAHHRPQQAQDPSGQEPFRCCWIFPVASRAGVTIPTCLRSRSRRPLPGGGGSVEVPTWLQGRSTRDEQLAGGPLMPDALLGPASRGCLKLGGASEGC